MGQAFDSFLRLGFLNDSLLFFPLSLVPPAAKEGKGDCEYPLRTVRFAPGVPVCNKLPTSSRAQARDLRRSPYALLGFSYYPFVTPGTACQGAVTAGGIRSIELSISGGRFYDAAIDMVALLPCLDHAQTALNLCRFLCVEHTHTEPQGLIIASAPTLIYGGRGMDGRSYNQ